jgi:uncharacterized membrane protein YeaQ/YmgE (transglycosylase-associated protein family)
MGLIILIAVGAILGWLASIILRIDDRQGILLNVAAGVGGASISGLFTRGGSILAGISGFELLVGVAGSIVLLVLLNLIRKLVIH